LEEQIQEGHFQLLARPADEVENKLARPGDRHVNPLVIKCVMNFNLYCSTLALSSGVRPLDLKIILGCKTLHQLFVTVLKHFRECLFSSNKTALNQTSSSIGVIPSKPYHSVGDSKSEAIQVAEKGADKFD
jgi:hypothetical protein